MQRKGIAFEKHRTNSKPNQNNRTTRQLCNSETNVLKAPFLSLSLSHMAAAPVLNTETFPKSLLSFSCLSSRFLHFSSVINIGPFQSKSVKPLKNFLHYRYSTSQSLESNLSNSKHSLPGRGEEEAVNISFITILSYLIGNGY